MFSLSFLTVSSCLSPIWLYRLRAWYTASRVTVIQAYQPQNNCLFCLTDYAINKFKDKIWLISQHYILKNLTQGPDVSSSFSTVLLGDLLFSCSWAFDISFITEFQLSDSAHFSGSLRTTWCISERNEEINITVVWFGLI